MRIRNSLRLATALGGLCLLAGCGEPGPAGIPDAGPACGTPQGADVLYRLQALPGVTATELAALPGGYRSFGLLFTQPVDHRADGGPTFQQRVALLHTGLDAPTIAFTTGYADYQRGRLSEPARLTAGNQVSIEHRFFGGSRPDPADWSTLTIAQMAADEHRVIQALRCLYPGAWVSSGGSKGGMTAVYHRRFYPDDVAGTLAYVAPLSFGVPDHRYDAFLDGVRPLQCRDAVRAAALEMLQHRWAALLARAQAQADARNLFYRRVALGPALESAILDLEWTYWQYVGPAGCGSVPASTASDDALWAFLDQVSAVSFSDDPGLADFEAYFHQAYAQLGSPGTTHVRGDSLPAALAPFVRYGEADYLGTFPPGVPLPAFDPTAMEDIDRWVRTEGRHLVFLYGEVDPWSAGAFRLGDAGDALLVVAPGGTHGSGVGSLSAADRAAVLARLAAWTASPAPLRALEEPALWAGPPFERPPARLLPR